MTALVRAATDGRHEPASHPVRRQVAMRDRLFDALPPISAMQQVVITSHIEQLAQGVVYMPDVPLTPQQRRSLHVIARELTRRALVPSPEERS